MQFSNINNTVYAEEYCEEHDIDSVEDDENGGSSSNFDDLADPSSEMEEDISKEELQARAELLKKNNYGKYLLKVVEETK